MWVTTAIRSILTFATTLFVVASILPGVGAQGTRCASGPIIGSPPLLGSGVLTAATNATIPPYQFVDPQGKLQGLRIEFGNELACRMGLKMQWVNAEFPAHIPGLQGNRWDASITGMFYTPARAQIVYMLLYEIQAISISVPRGNPQRITSTQGLGGKRVGVEIGGYEESNIRRINTQQVASGITSMDIRTFNTFADAYQALRAGQLDAVVSVDATAKFYQDRGDFERATSGVAGSPASIAFKSKDVALAALRVANQMKRDGFYDKLFDRYGVAKWPGRTFEVRGPGL